MHDTVLTVTGHLVDDVTLQHLESGLAVARFRIASTPRRLDTKTGEWVDGTPMFLNVQVWRDQALNLAESVGKGSRVVVFGRLYQRNYTTEAGENRTAYEIEADEIGVSVRYRPARHKPTPAAAGPVGGPR